MQQSKEVRDNPLAYEKIEKLLLKFALPAAISMLVGALYNIVDQIFIGQGVGMLGNAATNVAFPITTCCTALALLFGIGSASNFNLEMGRGNQERAGLIAGTGLSMLVICGFLLCGVVLLGLEPLLRFFGATESVLPYARTYASITAFGIPLIIFTTGGSHMMRADGSPRFAMVCTLSGAVLNTILDPLFIFVFDMGMAGAAWATVAGQLVSALMAIYYFFHFKTVKLTPALLRPKPELVRVITALGMASLFNQLSMTIVQIVMNKTLTHYGALSAYGADIPLACVGVISKTNIVFMALIIGISQGCQPIFGFNYGAKNYGRVKQTYKTAVCLASCFSIAAFLCFQLLPRQIVAIFGDGSEEYFRFAVRYMRIFMALTFVNGIQPITSNFFTSIGKAKIGMFIAMTRQFLCLIPLIAMLPLFWGIDGVMFAGPIADGIAAILAVLLVLREMNMMTQMEQLQRRRDPRREA